MKVAYAKTPESDRRTSYAAFPNEPDASASRLIGLADRPLPRGSKNCI